VCPTLSTTDWIEEETWNALAGILLEPGRLEAAIEAMAEDQADGQTQADLLQIETQLADAKESQEILYAEYVRALKSKQNTFADRLKNDWMMAEATVAQFEQKVKDYRNRIEACTETKALTTRFRQRLDRVREGITRGDVMWQEKRDALEVVGTKNFSSGTDADIDFEVFPSDQWAALPQPRSTSSAGPSQESERLRTTSCRRASRPCR
jgi:hypothetical protein